MWEVLHKIKLVGVMERREVQELENRHNQDNEYINHPKKFLLPNPLTGLESMWASLIRSVLRNNTCVGVRAAGLERGRVGVEL